MQPPESGSGSEREPHAKKPVPTPAGVPTTGPSGGNGNTLADTVQMVSPGDGAGPEAPEGVGSLVKQYALYPFFIVIGIVAVFTLFGLLLRDHKSEFDYLRDVRTARGDDRWYAAYQLANWIAKQGDDLQENPEFRTEVADAFRQAGDSDPRVQRYLTLVLGRIGDASTEPLLIEALADDDPETRMWSAWALGRIGESQSATSLVGALEDPDPGVRMMVAYALGHLRDDRATEPLLRRLQDENEEVRWNAAIALAQNGVGDSYPILRQMLDARYLSGFAGMTDERVKDVMMNAVKALGVLQESYPSARDLLEETSRQAPFPSVQREAREQLGPRTESRERAG